MHKLWPVLSCVRVQVAIFWLLVLPTPETDLAGVGAGETQAASLAYGPESCPHG